MNANRLVVCVMVLMGVGGGACAQIDGGDIALSADAWGRLRTALSSEDGVVFPGERVYPAWFDVAPNFTNEPGFDSEPGAFVPGTPIGFNIRAALRVWDAEEQNFDRIPPETVAVQLGPLGPIVTPSSDEPVAGFSLAAGADGKYHHHFGYSLRPPAAAGVYLLELEVVTDDGSLSPSRPMYIVFNQNVGDAELAAAVRWVRSHYTCAADVNDDRSVDLGDFFDFFNAFDVGLGAADINADDTLDLSDFFAFFNAFDAGC